MKMKAIVCTKFGFPTAIQLKEVEKPIPGENDVLVENFASCVNYNNQILVRSKFLPLRWIMGNRLMSKYRIPGTNMAGRVELVGKNVKQIKPGDDVYGDLFGNGQGCFAEYVCAPENAVALKPTNLSYEEAAALPEVALVALRGLRDYGKIQKGHHILIYSASGGIGTIAIQIAKYYGAEVTAVCSARNSDLVRSLGADHVIDYTKEDFTRSGNRFDIIFAIRYTRSIFAIRRALNPGGIYVSTAGPSITRLFQEFFIGPQIFRNESKRIAVINPEIKGTDLDFLRELIEADKIKPVIDRSYPLRETAEAFKYYGKGHARGKVVISIK
jgi:NADPH:quinone reductase-like Zn-dependent oxidoreductase